MKISNTAFMTMTSIIIVQLITIIYLIVFKAGALDPIAKPSLHTNNLLTMSPSVEIKNEVALPQLSKNTNPALEESLEKTQERLSVPSKTAEQIANEQEAAMSANSLFDYALAKGKWEQNDTFLLLEHLGNLSEEDSNLLYERFHTSFNAQELMIDEFPPM